MSVTTIAGVIGNIVTALYAWPFSRDGNTDRANGVFPRFTIDEGISRVRMNASATHLPRMSELLQLNIWQKRNPDGTVENVAVRPAIEKALDDFVPVSIGNNQTLMRLVADGPGVSHDYDKTTGVVHDAITIRAILQVH